jgi:hypothetical protein
MNEINTKCPSCGAELKPDARFCGKCGHPVRVDVPPSAPPPIPAGMVPPPIQSAASPVNAAPPAVASSPTGQEKVLTVISKISRKTGVFSSEQFHLVVTDQRLIFARQTKDTPAHSETRYASAAPDLILAENPQNFALPLDQVTEINTYQAGFEESDPDSMEVIAAGQKLKFNIANYYGVQKRLKAVLGSKVK